ncbi:heparinase II/III family protein [Algibacter sp. L4_22]|nr:heparinase II/III family protein [Algibacter sp. L4_22]
MQHSKLILMLFFLGIISPIYAQDIPSGSIIKNQELSNYLKESVKVQLGNESEISIAVLANYLREKFSERYFFNWKNKDERFLEYKSLYVSAEKSHIERAKDHMAKFPDAPQWKLPFNYQNGEPVNAYAMRHLARQHKMIDIAYLYHYRNKDTTYLDYFKNQLKSLNTALASDQYEKIEDGNGVFESFRSGYRVLNWLQIHNLFLGEESYTDEDELITIATLLQHGQHLYEHNAKFHAGNHQTRGLSALAMLSILLRDFEGTDIWYNHAMKLLEEHLSKEINDDGFQFERTVHYHMSDIGNYYYVYQLAKMSNLDVSPFWKDRLKSLFVSLTKIAYPDKSAPVLSDDTDDPWAEKNNISGALTLGYLLFDSPKMGYFANSQVDAKMFWYVTDKQLEMLSNIESKSPSMKSVEFATTGYYIMREGWEKNDKMMIISAGLDTDKPDHQHGDMLGVQAMANGKVVLPNYQVRYSLEDLELFKNSMTKNVALVDDELIGKQYTSNKGGSGFGKFLNLPKPKITAWEKNKDLDIFIGSHDGFENIGVKYNRQVIYLKDDFWIVKDNFTSEEKHTYKQVWQGHYTLEEGANLIRSSFDDASGLDILQINKADAVLNSGQRGKQWSVVSKMNENNFSFITALYPYEGYSNRIDENAKMPKIKGWELNTSSYNITGEVASSLSKGHEVVLFSAKSLELNSVKIEFSESSDMFIKYSDSVLTIQCLGKQDVKTQVKTSKINEAFLIKPGEVILIKI